MFYPGRGQGTREGAANRASQTEAAFLGRKYQNSIDPLKSSDELSEDETKTSTSDCDLLSPLPTWAPSTMRIPPERNIRLDLEIGSRRLSRTRNQLKIGNSF